jgi:hypothetical protein
MIADAVIENKLRDLCDLYDVREIIFDPKFAAKMMARLGGTICQLCSASSGRSSWAHFIRSCRS